MKRCFSYNNFFIMIFPGNIAVMGGGSWATALAHLLLNNCDNIIWYMRRKDRIDEFKACGHNPAYLTDLPFDTQRIFFTDDINHAARQATTLLLAMPSPYFKEHADKLNINISHKNIITAIKGIVPGENQLVTDYMMHRYGIPRENMLVVSGPCHAEEVALDRPAYLTVGCSDREKADAFGHVLAGGNCRTISSTDVDGIEYAGVLKNVYAVAAGVIYGLKRGDNLQAMLVSNAIREMERFINAVDTTPRNICDSVYLGDLLVTAYSRFSRNHNFGSMIGRGYSVKSAKMEMEQTAEGYYGTKCMHEINATVRVDMPILECVYDILYRGVSADTAVRTLSPLLT